MITDKMYYKMIDNLPYSIKPKNYDEFRRNLTKCLKKNGIKVPVEMVSEHSIMVICMMYIQDVFEFDMVFPKDFSKEEEYMGIIMEPLTYMN